MTAREQLERSLDSAKERERNAEQPDANVRALDYYRLSESLDELAADARYFANVWTMPVP